MLRSVDNGKATGPFFLTLSLNMSRQQSLQTRNLLANLRKVSSMETLSRNVTPRTAPTAENFVPLPHSQNIGESNNNKKQNPIFSKIYPGGQAYTGISQTADEIYRHISIGEKNDDDLSERAIENRVLIVLKFKTLTALRFTRSPESTLEKETRIFDA